MGTPEGIKNAHVILQTSTDPRMKRLAQGYLEHSGVCDDPTTNTPCCGAYATYDENGQLYCKACHKEV